MARLNVNPTRMELSNLKRRLKTAVRGHKLLKDKRDELMRQFLDIVKECQKLRLEVESELTDAYRGFSSAAAMLSPEMLEQTFLYPKQSTDIGLRFQNIMSVDVPVYSFETKTQDSADIFPYSFSSTPAELDDSVMRLFSLMNKLLLLAEKEKTVMLLAQEIEKTRRRVNALEYVMIPQFEETIKYIVMKLDENERGNTTRLMKVKDMMLEQTRQKALEQLDSL